MAAYVYTVFQEYGNILQDYMLAYEKSNHYKKGGQDTLYLLLNGCNVLTHLFKMVLAQTNHPASALTQLRHSI